MRTQDSIQQEFGRRARLLREKRGLSQERFALVSGLARSYVSSVDRGLRNISLFNIWRIAETLEITPEAFFMPETAFNDYIESLEKLKV